MFNISLSVFDEPDDDPQWDIEDEEALSLLDAEEKLKFKVSSYDESDEFEEALPLGYQGFAIRDEETGKYWRVKGDRVYKFDTNGVHKAQDDNCLLEKLLREFAKKRGDIWYSLSEPTKYVAPDED